MLCHLAFPHISPQISNLIWHPAVVVVADGTKWNEKDMHYHLDFPHIFPQVSNLI